MKVLVLGGYGNFGARIGRALAGHPQIELSIGGRDAAKAASFAASLGQGVEGMAIDHSRADFAQRLLDLGVGLVIHSAGPFQCQDYGVARSAAAAGAHYIDLADGRRFVCDFGPALDDTFRTAGCCAISGASTVPALSSAVVDELCRGWQRIDEIDFCIAPAQTAPRGVATLEAVLSYCGAPIQVWEHGRWQARSGWARPERVSFRRMAARRGALCDIPDLELFVARYQPTRRVMFRAALEVAVAQRGFDAVARLRERGLVNRPERLARTLHRAGRWLDRFGSSLGGMVVRVVGVGPHGQSLRRAWHIAADHDHGPEIPCMAAILLARRLAEGGPPPAGARPCMGLLTLDDFAPEFARWGMVTDIVDEAGPLDAPAL
jgi:hypothetical protein